MRNLLPSHDAIAELAGFLLVTPDSATRASLISAAVVAILPDSACVVHRTYLNKGEAAWKSMAAAGAFRLVTTPYREIAGSSPLSSLRLHKRKSMLTLTFAGRDYSHLHINRTVVGLAYASGTPISESS